MLYNYNIEGVNISSKIYKNEEHPYQSWTNVDAYVCMCVCVYASDIQFLCTKVCINQEEFMHYLLIIYIS